MKLRPLVFFTDTWQSIYLEEPVVYRPMGARTFRLHVPEGLLTQEEFMQVVGLWAYYHLGNTYFIQGTYDDLLPLVETCYYMGINLYLTEADEQTWGTEQQDHQLN